MKNATRVLAACLSLAPSPALAWDWALSSTLSESVGMAAEHDEEAEGPAVHREEPLAAGQPGHHLGHGVGLQPHEYPHLNPKWDDVLMEGEIFTAEPGQYSDELKAGIRLENDYLVTKDGVESLFKFPLELA